jgi:hypothetical protein
MKQYKLKVTASRKYGTGENCTRGWRKKKELMLQSSGNWTAFHCQKVKYTEMSVQRNREGDEIVFVITKFRYIETR